MDLKITFDVTPAVLDVTERICAAIGLRFIDNRGDYGRLRASEEESQPSKPAEPVEVPPAEAKADTQDSPKRSRRKSEPKAEPAPVIRAAYELSAAPEPAQKPAPAPDPKSEPAPEPATEPAPEHAPEPATEPATEPAPEHAQNDEKAKALSIDEVRRVCLRATKAGKTQLVIDFLHAKGAENLPSLDPSLYESLVKVVEDNL